MPVTHLIARIGHELRSGDSRVRAGQKGRDRFGIDLGRSALKHFRIGDIQIVGDAAVLLSHKVVMIYERLQLIAVAHIRRRQPPRQILVGLIGIASLRIKIVDRSAKLQATVDITGKIGLQTILRRFRPPDVL